MFWNKKGNDDEPIGLYVPEDDEDEIEEEVEEDEDLDVRMSWDDEDEEVEETEEEDLDDFDDEDFYVDPAEDEDDALDFDKLDEEAANEDYITLTTADGEEVDFVEIAGIAYKGNFYAILQPVELLEGMDDDEALVFKVTKNRDGSDNFEIELDDEIIEAVFTEYGKLLDEANN
ncbi:MAG: DUF1292 domain-containing protein [Clostridia bacterium]|nr:DUF1292 domain-containing protein [Clostridia bacterium]